MRIRATGASSGDAVFAVGEDDRSIGPGRAGVAYPALRTEETALSPVTLFGLRETAAFRTNLALVNTADPAQATSVVLQGDPHER